MKLVAYNTSPLAFYDNESEQERYRPYAYKQVHPLIMRLNVILPFQVVLIGCNSISDVYLVNANTLNTTYLTTSMIENGLKLVKYSDYSILKYNGTLPITALKYEGLYYLKVHLNTDNGIKPIYSEVFAFIAETHSHICLQYKNSYNIELNVGHIDFSDNFEFKCYLYTQIGKPEYVFEEQATDRMGYTFIESQVSKKVYNCIFLAPEYLCDALRIVRLCDNKIITDNFKIYNLNTFNIEPEWEDQGDLASVSCEFETGTIIANIGGCTKEPIGGEFNSDFNSDFNNDYMIKI